MGRIMNKKELRTHSLKMLGRYADILPQDAYARLLQSFPALVEKMQRSGMDVGADSLTSLLARGEDHLKVVAENLQPPEIRASRAVLDALRGDMADEDYQKIAKILPILASKMAAAGEAVDEDILSAHARRGVQYLEVLHGQYQTKKKVIRSYDSITERWKAEQEAKKEEKRAQKEALKAQLDATIDQAVRERDLQTILTTLHQGNPRAIMNPSYALMLCATTGHLEGVRFLIECGANVTEHGSYALRAGASNGHAEIVKLLVEHGADVHAYNEEALRSSAMNGHTEIVKFLVASGADTSQCNWQAVREAAQYAYNDIVEILLSHDADASVLGNILKHAAAAGRFEIVKLLVENGADINADFGNALMGSVREGHIEIVRFLIEQGADIHVLRDKPLMIAVYQGYQEMVRLLVENGVDMHVHNDYAFHESARKGHLEIVKYLLEQGEDFDLDKAFVESAAANQVEIMRLLVQHGVDVKAMNNLAPHLNFHCASEDAVKYLVEMGADISLLYNQISIKMFIENNIGVLDLLIRSGFDLGEYRAFWEKEKETGGRMAISAAGQSEDRWQKEVIAPLESYRIWKKLFPTFKDSAKFGLFRSSPYHFSPEGYDAAKVILAKEGYKDSIGQHYAYHAACLFKTEQRMLDYLERWGRADTQPFHDLIQHISIPQKGKPDMAAWGDAVIKHGPKMARLVKFSDRLAQPIKGGDGGWSYLATRAEVAKYAYEKGKENPTLAQFCMEYAWEESQFNEALGYIKKFKKQYQSQECANDNIKGGTIPDLAIEGKLFGKDGYRFRKLPDGDVRGLLLGEFTGCCQHLAGAGADCAKHGFISPHGGFYVLEDEKSGEIVAQSWAWRGTKGELVLDSLESLSGHMDADKWQALCKQLSKQVASHANTQKISALFIGAGGVTPEMRQAFKDAASLAYPVDYHAYRDSKSLQYEVARFKI